MSTASPKRSRFGGGQWAPRLGLLVASCGSLYASGAAAAHASCTDLIFADSFETGDTSRWGAPLAILDTSGTWVFSLDFAGTNRPFAVELVERFDGRLVGYVLGGTSRRMVAQGAVTGATVSFDLEFNHPLGTATVGITGARSGNTIHAAASGDIATQTVRLDRLPCELFETQLVAAELPTTRAPAEAGERGSSGEPEHTRLIAVVLDAEDNFVAGGFVGEEDCDLWACDGGLTSFSLVGDSLTVGLETAAGCSGTSSFNVTADPSDFFFGTYSFSDCSGSSSGNLVAGFGMSTSSLDVRAALRARVEIADALETGAPLTTPFAGFASGYLNFGKTESALRDELNVEIASYADIEVELSRARNSRSLLHPRTLPDLMRPFGLTVDERRSGTSVGQPVTFRDTAKRPIIDDAALFGRDAGEWKILGNQVAAFDLPFASTIPSGAAQLEAPTAYGSPVYVSIGPYGGHFLPLTGDPSGEAKANFVGFLPRDDSEMEELVGDGDGIRELGETWGYPPGGDITGDAVRQRRPVFVAPQAGVVSAVAYEAAPSGTYFDNEPQWRVDLKLPGDVTYALGHVGKIVDPLRSAVLAASGIDPDTFTGPVGTDLLAGIAPLPVAAGDALALPQILADPVPGFPGYWIGGGSFLEWPWAQIEFQVPLNLPNEGGDDLGSDYCVYRLFSSSRRAELQTMMDADMLDPTSQRYRPRIFYKPWHWQAQGGLCQSENALPTDFSDLYTSLGGWFERSSPGTVADELFSFIPIDTTAGVYSALNYDSASVRHLVLRSRHPAFYTWTMPDTSVAHVPLPVGEVLERTASELLIKWRDLNGTNPVVYQRAAYRLDALGLTIEWGNFASTTVGAVQPELLPGEACNDLTILCYDHSLGAWPP